MRISNWPDAARKFGLEPVIIAGAKGRGAPLDKVIRGSLDHHTVAPAGYMPSLKTLINGRGAPKPLPGPLAQVGTPRSEPRDMTVYFIADGVANHAGPGIMGTNSNLLGVERELKGDGSDITPHRHDVACRVHAAFIETCGYPIEMVRRHAYHATPAGRKIDTAGVADIALQDRVRALRSSPSVPTPQEIISMESQFVADMLRIYLGAPDSYAAWSPSYVQSFDYWLHMLLVGAASKEFIRTRFRETAMVTAPPRLA